MLCYIITHIILYSILLYYIILYYIILYHNILYHVLLYHIISYYIILGPRSGGAPRAAGRACAGPGRSRGADVRGAPCAARPRARAALGAQGDHLSKATCPTLVFFRRCESCGRLWLSLTRRNTHKTKEAALDR